MRTSTDTTQQAGIYDGAITNIRIIEGYIEQYDPFIATNNGGSTNNSSYWIMMHDRALGAVGYIQTGLLKMEGDTHSHPWLQLKDADGTTVNAFWNGVMDPTYPELLFPDGSFPHFQIRWDGSSAGRFDVYFGLDGYPISDVRSYRWRFAYEMGSDVYPTAFEVAGETINTNDQLFGATSNHAYMTGLRFQKQGSGWQKLDANLSTVINHDPTKFGLSYIEYTAETAMEVWDKACTS